MKFNTVFIYPFVFAVIQMVTSQRHVTSLSSCDINASVSFSLIRPCEGQRSEEDEEMCQTDFEVYNNNNHRLQLLTKSDIQRIVTTVRIKAGNTRHHLNRLIQQWVSNIN